MLTRLQVSGFKNLVDVDVRFGPFTCVAGVNGVGKSNLFDAIQFLSYLADRPLMEAAMGVRGGRTAGVRNLFHRVGEHCDERMSFCAEMIIPRHGLDEFGQEAEATSTFLRYELELCYRDGEGLGSAGYIEILRERLKYITQGDAFKHLLFDHSANPWRWSVVKNDRSGGDFISTIGSGPGRKIQLHQDGGSRGQPVGYAAARSPRTIVSGTNGAESPTVLLARREMQSWRVLQLEPTALREPDPFTAPSRIDSDGSHLAATLYRLARQNGASNGDEAGEARLYAQVANRLSELFEDVRSLRVDRDERRELFTIQVRTGSGTEHPAPALSDGSLRFLALTVLELDREDQGLLCLEEPENGVHPERLPAMLRLLQDIAVDPREESGPDNPLRQVIINTHSPAVVQQIPEHSLLVAVPLDLVHASARTKAVTFRALAGTWRQKEEAAPPALSLGNLMSYLRPVTLEGLRLQLDSGDDGKRQKAVVERDDLQPLLPLSVA